VRQHLARLTGHRLHRRLLAQVRRVVAVLVPRHDLVDPLAQQGLHPVVDVACVAPIGHQLDQPRAQTQPLVELSNQRQTALGRYRSPGEVNRQFALENETRFATTLCTHRHPSDLL
jgi:hypothetical protein